MKALKTIGIAICAFLAFCVVVAIFDDSDSSSENKTEPQQTEQAENKLAEQANQSTQEEQKKDIESKASQVFFEGGYRYTASYRINRKEGWGISANYNYTLDIYKDGTTEIQFKRQADGFPEEHDTQECKIEKKSNSYKDVAATWYEITWTHGSTYGGNYHIVHNIIYADEKGNIIHLGENGNDKDIHQAIATGDCIFGKFEKRPL